ncbi:cellular tumor antigen p53 isoform X2 [Exaiptasia diaphana]|uniref:p53 DNA-binding domain-containing protein n=1 Tax=Exaiptasia diaphana TaxID=2652724 RepID=A0A913X491_EXADI|nr:cellular tumor antigen p53 isoform X2 [Exaiptasia diaphana]XP_020898671.1 cellular tumor antigen p53 isoform X2 [Exaiptasia diaphana]XP_020898672.1 cellular tumor antigen p53 isoform X2 [Exaiptasia diaphana]KXJ15346.1 Tumor protein p73 [Exaiptasia diaphana]
MADDNDSNIEPTIGIGEKHYKTILEDVRGTTRSSCFFNVGGEETDFNPEIRSMFPGYPIPYGSHGDFPPQTTGPPAYPQNIQGPMYTNVNTAGRRTPVSPVSNQSDMHYDNKSDLSPGHSPYNSHLPTIPSTTEYPGEMGFAISFGPATESASKSATWTYSESCKKLYVNLASFCPIKFKTDLGPPLGCYLRAVAVFKGSTNLHDIVKRCPNHSQTSGDSSDNNLHFIRSNNPAAHYHTCPESGRHSVVIPYHGPQVGTEYVTEMFAFMCFSSCPSGPSRRPVEIIFTLEKDGITLGRRVVEIRVCACPGRDRKSNESLSGVSSTSASSKRKKGQGKSSKKQRATSSGDEGDKEWTITGKDIRVYNLLMTMKEQLESQFMEETPIHHSEDEDPVFGPSTSTSTATSYPNLRYKRVGHSSM